jgi:Cu2+-containing amine oxidase
MRTEIVEENGGSGRCALSNLTGAFNLNKQHGMLSEAEVAYAVGIVKLRHNDKILQFIEINFLEPTKSDMRSSFATKSSLRRRAEVITISLELNQTLVDEVIINSSQYATESDGDVGTGTCGDSGACTLVVPNAQPGLSPDEYAFVEKLCKSYSPLLNAIAARGLDPAGLRADAWCVGHTGPDCDPTERVCWPSLFYQGTGKDETDDLIYARPVEGIEMRISLTHKKVIRFEDNSKGLFPIPGSREGIDTKYVPREFLRRDLKPLVITQPEGPSWTVSDINTVEWQHWRFQVGFNSREGATIHGLSYDGRPILNKFSFCEMVS